MNEVNMNNDAIEPKKKSNGLLIAIILIVLIAIGVGCYFIFKPTDDPVPKPQDKGGEQEVDYASKFEGIYAAENDKMYIHKSTNTRFNYMIGGNFQGTATANGETAKEDNYYHGYFEFKLVDGGIELIYHGENENSSVAADTGLYKRVADYSKENIYKESVGDPKYLEESKYSGIYKSGDYTLYVYQINEKEVQVDLDSTSLIFSKKFTIKNDTLLTADSFFEEGTVEYELVFKDKSFTLKYHDGNFGFDEDSKVLALEYKYEKALTQDEILNKFYKGY